MRKILLIGGVLLTCLAAGVGLLLLFVDVNQYRPTVQTQLEQRLHRSVALGKMGLKVFPLSIRIEDVSIGDAPEFSSSRPFLTTREMSVSVGLAALLSKKIEVDSLRIAQPQVSLIRTKNGKWNFEALTASGSNATVPTARRTSDSSDVALKELLITDGQVTVADVGAKSTKVYDHIDITLRDFAPGQHFNLESRMHPPGQSKDEVEIRAQGSGMTNVDGSVAYGGATLAKFQVSSGAQGQREIAMHCANAPIAGLLKLAAALGELPPGLSGSGDLTLDTRALESGDAVTISGKGAIHSGTFTLQHPQSKDQIAIQDLTTEIGPTQTRASGGAKSELEGAGTVKIGKVTYNQVNLSDVVADYKLANGIVRLSPLSAKLYGGQESGDLSIDTRTFAPGYTLQARLTGVDVNQALSAVSAVKNTVYGTLGANANLKIAPGAGPDLAKGLNGVVQMHVTDGKLTGIHLMSGLASVGKFLGYQIPSDRTTKISKMSGTLNIANGVANTNDLVVEFEGGSLTGVGAIGLADQSLDMKLTAVLDKNYSDQVGGSKIGGFMSTAMANSKGELVIPAKLTGTFNNPHFEPDAAQMAKLKLGGLLPSKATPAALLDSATQLLGGGSQKTTSGAKSVLDVLSGFGKKKDK